MGQGDVFFDVLPDVFSRVAFECGDQSRHLGKSADMFVFNAAFPGSFPLRVASEESPMVFLQVGVPVQPGVSILVMKSSSQWSSE